MSAGNGSADERIKIHEIIVVEGLHDRQAVERAVLADVFVLGGDRTGHRIISELKRAAKVRGVVVLTDPDGPGERIRRRLDQAIGHCCHAYLAKSDAIMGGRVGVEFATPTAITDAVRKALERERRVAGQVEGFGPSREPGFASGDFSTEDLLLAGLMGTPEATKRREMVGERLGIGYANAKSFVNKMNALCVTRGEWEEALKSMAHEGGGKGE